MEKLVWVTVGKTEHQAWIFDKIGAVRAQTRYADVALDKWGSMMVPILLRLLEQAENSNMKHADVSILNITKTLLYISQVSELR
jgi:hypothetical protein